MGLLSYILSKRKWVCRNCDRAMEVVREETPYSYWTITGEHEESDEAYQILRCPKCDRYAVVGYKPKYCNWCQRRHSGVYLTLEQTYFTGSHIARRIRIDASYKWRYGTYCKKCHRVDEYAAIQEDNNGYYYRLLGSRGSYLRYDIKLLPTLNNSEIKQEWRFSD